MLKEENTLHSGGVFATSTNKGIGYAGLWVKKGAELVIQGDGQLTAIGGCGIEDNKKTNGGAGIGGSNIGESAEGAMGNITIKSGTIMQAALKCPVEQVPALAGQQVTMIQNPV